MRPAVGAGSAPRKRHWSDTEIAMTRSSPVFERIGGAERRKRFRRPRSPGRAPGVASSSGEDQASGAGGSLRKPVAISLRRAARTESHQGGHPEQRSSARSRGAGGGSDPAVGMGGGVRTLAPKGRTEVLSGQDWDAQSVASGRREALHLPPGLNGSATLPPLGPARNSKWLYEAAKGLITAL